MSEEVQADFTEEKIVQKALHELGEHFDCVQIFVTSKNGEHTECIATGSGNFYARMGIVRNWIVREEERTRVRVRKSEEEEEE